jgi:VanZ family protein
MVIFFLCMLPGSEVPTSGQLHLDKFVHTILFGLFTFCLMIGFTKQHQFSFLSSHVVIVSFFFTALYGLFIELFQEFVLNDRAFELLDIAADIIGVLIGYLCFLTVMGKKLKKV